MQYSNDHQDWKPVVLNKTSKISSNTKPNQISNSRTNLEIEDKIPDKYSNLFIQEVITKRNQLNMKQIDLAKKLGVTLQKVQWFEQGRETYEGPFVDKLKRNLGKFVNNAKKVVEKIE